MLIAEVDDDEEEDEEDWEEGAAELIERKSLYEGPTAKELESNRRLNELMKYVQGCRRGEFWCSIPYIEIWQSTVIVEK